MSTLLLLLLLLPLPLCPNIDCLALSRNRCSGSDPSGAGKICKVTTEV